MQNPTINFEVGELLRTKFSLFDNYEPNVRKEQIKKVFYITDIAEQLGKNINGINLFKLLKNNNNIILAENNEINRALATFKRSDYVTDAVAISLLDDTETKAIDNIYVGVFKRQIRTMDDLIETQLTQAAKSSRQQHTSLKEANRVRGLKTSHQKRDSSKITDGINRLLTTGKYQIVSIRGDEIELLIRDDIIMTYKKPMAGINLRVNFGKMAIKLSFSEGIEIIVQRYENNIPVGNNQYYHPHLSYKGDVCLGNMDDIYECALEEDDVYTAIDAIHKVLYTYYDGQPYHAIQTFAMKSGQIQPNGKVVEVEPRQQERVCHECGEYITITFPAECDGDNINWECPECEHEADWEYDYERE